jgi:hypothetical protein
MISKNFLRRVITKTLNNNNSNIPLTRAITPDLLPYHFPFTPARNRLPATSLIKPTDNNNNIDSDSFVERDRFVNKRSSHITVDPHLINAAPIEDMPSRQYKDIHDGSKPRHDDAYDKNNERMEPMRIVTDDDTKDRNAENAIYLSRSSSSHLENSSNKDNTTQKEDSAKFFSNSEKKVESTNDAIKYDIWIKDHHGTNFSQVAGQPLTKHENKNNDIQSSNNVSASLQKQPQKKNDNATSKREKSRKSNDYTDDIGTQEQKSDLIKQDEVKAVNDSGPRSVEEGKTKRIIVNTDNDSKVNPTFKKYLVNRDSLIAENLGPVMRDRQTSRTESITPIPKQRTISSMYHSSHLHEKINSKPITVTVNIDRIEIYATDPSVPSHVDSSNSKAQGRFVPNQLSLRGYLSMRDRGAI